MAVVPPPPIVCQCSVWSRSFVLARKERGLRALHLDHACALAKGLAAVEKPQQNEQPGRSPDLRENRVSIKLGVLHLLRQYFPKGTDLSRWSSEDLEAVALAINNRPRKILGWKSAAEVYEEQLRSLQQPGVASTG